MYHSIIYLQFNKSKIFSFLNSRVTQQREAEHEINEKAKQLEAQLIEPSTPKSKIEPPITHPSQSETQNKMHATPDSIGMPVFAKFMENASDSSPATSTISAASVTTLSNVWCRGRQHKIVSRPDYSDFLVGGTYEEQECWFKAKHTWSEM